MDCWKTCAAPGWSKWLETPTSALIRPSERRTDGSGNSAYVSSRPLRRPPASAAIRVQSGIRDRLADYERTTAPSRRDDLNHIEPALGRKLRGEGERRFIEGVEVFTIDELSVFACWTRTLVKPRIYRTVAIISAHDK